MEDLESLKKEVKDHEKRIKHLELELEKVQGGRFTQAHLNEERHHFERHTEKEAFHSHLHEKRAEPKESSFPSFSFSQLITFLGVLGLIIGVISFFFYAVANRMIGESTQVLIGICVGFLLFGFAYFLQKKNALWAHLVFGGSFFIQYLSVGVGVQKYHVLSPLFGVLLALLFLLGSLFLSLRFSSRAIGYFSLAGGFMIPFITNTFNNDLFVMSFYLLLCFGLVFLSFKKEWADLRFVCFFIMSFFLASSSEKLFHAPVMFVPVLFLTGLFVLFNVASLVGAVKGKKELSALDSIVLVFLSLVYLVLMKGVLDWSVQSYGFFVIAFSFLYFFELSFFRKNFGENVPISLQISLFTTGLTTLNIGILMVFKSFNADFFMILFALQWAFFLFVGSRTKKESYSIFSYIFLFLSAVWYFFVVRFDGGLAHASFFMLFYVLLLCVMMSFARRDILYKFNAALFTIFGFFVLYSFSKYLQFFISSEQFQQVILSVLWLVYTLFMFSNMRTKEGKILVGCLLGITLLKIAVVDLSYLHGAYRIVGFIVFGILLLIGGYFIKNEHEKK